MADPSDASPPGTTGDPTRVRWSVEQVEALAPSVAAVTAARPVATRSRWNHASADERGVWGSYAGTGSEPYDVVVDHVAVAFRCSCPSRRAPCKHVIGLLLLWARGELSAGRRPPQVEQWMQRSRAKSAASAAPAESDAGGSSASDGDAVGSSASDGDAVGRSGSRSADEESSAAPSSGTPDGDAPDQPPEPPSDTERDRSRDERVERMLAGLTELDRWLDDRLRTGLADPSLARYATWDELAARLVDARAGALANRIRRLAGLVGASPDWHGRVLEELGLLHLLSQAGRRVPELPPALADAVAASVGWQVRQDDVLAGVPDTDHWFVAGRSDTREDRIEVRRYWLRGESTGRWALLLSFAAYRQSLDTSWEVGTVVEADLHRYPGPALRAIVGLRHGAPRPAAPTGVTVAMACAEIGSIVAAEPWIERVPAIVRAQVTRGDGWVLTDSTGSLPILADPASTTMPTLLAVSGGAPVDMTIEWTPDGVVPLAVHQTRGTVDIGPRADASFVRVA